MNTIHFQVKILDQTVPYYAINRFFNVLCLWISLPSQPSHTLVGHCQPREEFTSSPCAS
jgi:hypothetical protein